MTTKNQKPSRHFKPLLYGVALLISISFTFTATRSDVLASLLLEVSGLTETTSNSSLDHRFTEGLVGHWTMDGPDTQMTTAPGSPESTATTPAGTGANDAATGTLAWTNPENITADDEAVATAAYPEQYSFYRTITLDHTQVSGGADLTDFPVMISYTGDHNLKYVSNGGHVTNINGYDIIFKDANGNQLDHEIETYDSANGSMVMWVRIPTLSASVDTVITMYYGNAAVTTSQEDKTGVWNSDFKGVWHLDEDPAGTAPQLKDSTANALHATTSYMESGDTTAARIVNGTYFNEGGTGNEVADFTATSLGTAHTVSYWLDPKNNYGIILGGIGDTAGDNTINYNYATLIDATNIYYSVGYNNYAWVPHGGLSADTFYHISIIRNGTSVSFYKNGTQLGTTQTLPQGNYPLTVSRFANYATGVQIHYSTAIIDEMQISTTNRSAGWIATAYNNQKASQTLISSYGTDTANPISTNYLKASNFGFNIPADATIDGVEVSFISSTTGVVNTETVRLLDASGAPIGDDRSTDTVWDTEEATIWPPTTTPANLTDNDTSGVNLGVKFQSAVDGYIKGIRFYKGPLNTGTHTVKLWTDAGASLGTATATNESASGWQEARFASPIAISANTTYVASYHAPNGRYSSDTNYFDSAYTAGDLTALADGPSSYNGLYLYSGSVAFPTNTYISTNYWVDVVFSETSGDSEVQTYGGNSDLWGTTLTPAIVNDPDFGFALGASIASGTASVDQMQIKVYYTPKTHEVVVADRGSGDNDGNGNFFAPTRGRLGQAMEFNGTSDFVTIDDDPALEPSNDMTISFWIKLDQMATTKGTDQMFLRKLHNPAPWFTYQVFQIASDDSIRLSWRDSSENLYSTGSTTDAVSIPGAWYHIVAVKDGTTGKIYVNGVDKTSWSNTHSGTLMDSNSSLEIGGVSDKYVDGTMDDIRVYNRALTPDEIVGLYNLGQVKVNNTRTDRVSDGLVGHWTMDGPHTNFGTNTATDLSGNGKNGTLVNMMSAYSAKRGKIGQALNFDGTNDYLTMGNVLNMGTNDFSISAWVKSTSTAGGNNNGIVYKKNGTAQTNTAGYKLNMANGVFVFSIADGTNARGLSGGSGYNDGNWHHVVAVADRGSEMKIYVDGVAKGSTPETTVGNIDSTWNLGVGAMNSPPSFWHPFNGSIDDVRIYDRALTDAEISDLYQMGQ